MRLAIYSIKRNNGPKLFFSLEQFFMLFYQITSISDSFGEYSIYK